MEMCYIHIFIYAEFEKIYMFLKERSLSYKQAISFFFLPCEWLKSLLSIATVAQGYNRDFTKCLVMEIWFKVLEIHWSKCVRTLITVY